MLNVAICDDEKKILITLNRYIEIYMKSQNRKINIRPFLSGRMLLSEFYKSKYNLIFLDISMPDVDGVVIAEIIRKTDKKVGIVFVTGRSECRDRAFRVHAFDYVVKPISQLKMNLVLNDFLEALEHNTTDEAVVTFTSNQIEKKVKLNSILYVQKEGNKNKTMIMTDDGIVEVYLPLKQILYTLRSRSMDFVQCHKSNIVNLNKVIKRDTIGCMMENGMKLEIGRNYQKVFKGDYYRHLRKGI